MISARILSISIQWAALAAPLLCAGNLSSYRGFQFGMDLPAVVKLVGMNSSEAKVIHQRPELIQELDWRPSRIPGSSPDTDSVKSIVFSFCNGALFRMVVNYDRYKTEGLTVEDMVEAISANYGTATRPPAEIMFPSIYNESVKVMARWEDSQYSFNLVRSSYQLSFGMVVYSKQLDALAQAAITEARRLDQQEAPQKELELRQKQQADSRVLLEKARLANKPSFRP